MAWAVTDSANVRCADSAWAGDSFGRARRVVEAGRRVCDQVERPSCFQRHCGALPSPTQRCSLRQEAAQQQLVPSLHNHAGTTLPFSGNQTVIIPASFGVLHDQPWRALSQTSASDVLASKRADTNCTGYHARSCTGASCSQLHVMPALQHRLVMLSSAMWALQNLRCWRA